MIAFRHADTMEIVARIVELAHTHTPAAIMVDGAGVGGGVVDRLRELGMPVVDVQVGAAAHNAARFGNLRAELFWALRQRFQNGAIAIPDDKELAAQLVGLRYKHTERGQLLIEGKRAIRNRGMPSPDKADALALAFIEPPSVGVWV